MQTINIDQLVESVHRAETIEDGATTLITEVRLYATNLRQTISNGDTSAAQVQADLDQIDQALDAATDRLAAALVAQPGDPLPATPVATGSGVAAVSSQPGVNIENLIVNVAPPVPDAPAPTVPDVVPVTEPGFSTMPDPATTMAPAIDIPSAIVDTAPPTVEAVPPGLSDQTLAEAATGAPASTDASTDTAAVNETGSDTAAPVSETAGPTGDDQGDTAAGVAPSEDGNASEFDAAAALDATATATAPTVTDAPAAAPADTPPSW